MFALPPNDEVTLRSLFVLPRAPIDYYEQQDLERISYECMAFSKTLDARFHEHDNDEVIPA